MEVRVPAEKFTSGSDEADGARYNGVIVVVDFEVQPYGAPGTSGQVPEETPVVAEEDSQPLWDGENDLTVRHLFEELFCGPIRPQQLTFLVATGTDTSQFA